MWKGLQLDQTSIAIFKNFENLVRACDRADLEELWNLVQIRLDTNSSTDAKEQELWVEFNRMFDPKPKDVHWKFPYYDPSTTWEFLSHSNIHHLYTQSGIELFMLAEKEYPLSYEVLKTMISKRLRCDKDEENSEVVQSLLRSIFEQCERKRKNRE